MRHLGGELTTYGRNGRTVIMSKLKLNFDDVFYSDYQNLNNTSLVELILALEWLNDYVRTWCKTYPENLYRHFKMEISK